MKPYAESSVQNREPILSVIKPLFAKRKHILEIGSGTGQHAVYFAEKMPHLIWQTSDRAENHAGIKMWLDEANLLNTRLPLALDVSKDQWSEKQYDAIISINCVHIMAKSDVQAMFAGCASVLSRGGLLVLYGPFNYGGQYSSESNARFDLWLKERNSFSGIRDFEWLDSLANLGGMTLQGDYEMPVNNRILCWEKV
ncbi:methylase [Candidatus Thiomargarita nelsonii]|uniref:Methylase n=1 Tax=Candidatus Thiomargarita nelsonii TaxID=1003181 RepID=A0A4E0QWD3_9GAMM|nr:methylase [Candidatus Thiomargarita nelsonii]